MISTVAVHPWAAATPSLTSTTSARRISRCSGVWARNAALARASDGITFSALPPSIVPTVRTAAPSGSIRRTHLGVE